MLSSIFNSCGDDVIAPALSLKDVMKLLFQEKVIKPENVKIKFDKFLKKRSCIKI